MRRLLALTMLQRGLAVGVYLVVSMILARLLTPAQVGVFSLSAAFMAIANVVREFGISEYLMQEKQLDRTRIRAAFGVALVVGWSMCVLTLLLRHPIAHFFNEPGVASVLSVLALTFVFLPFATPVTALLYREMAIPKILWIQTIGLVVGHVASVLFAWYGMGYLALAWGNVVNAATMVVVLMLARRDGMWFLPSLKGSRPIWSYCTKFTASGALETGMRNVHEFVIGRRFGFADLGIYSRAAGLFVQFNQNIGRGISRVLLPGFAKQAREGAADLRQQYRRTLELYTAIMWPAFGIAAVLAPEIIELMFGSQWQASAPLLRLLCIGAMVQCGYAFAGDLLGGMGQAGARLRITSVAAPLWVALCLLASLISLEAIALATAAHAAVLLVLYLKRLRSLIDFSARDLADATARSAALAVVVVLPCAAARHWLLGITERPALLLLAIGPLALALWLVGARLLGHPVANEVRRLREALAGRRQTP